jgi:hypothetical protein
LGLQTQEASHPWVGFHTEFTQITPEKSQQPLRFKDGMAKAALCLEFVLGNRSSGSIEYSGQTERKTD